MTGKSTAGRPKATIVVSDENESAGIRLPPSGLRKRRSGAEIPLINDASPGDTFAHTKDGGTQMHAYPCPMDDAADLESRTYLVKGNIVVRMDASPIPKTCRPDFT